MLSIDDIRKQFPILKETVNGKQLVYFDNAATTQKPQSVIDALTQYYSTSNANIHRGIHHLAEKATRAYEASRDTVQVFLNAKEREEIIFTKGTTDGVNLVAQSYGRAFIQEGDEILVSTLEHHSNIVPWQMLCKETGAELKVIPINDEGEFLMDEFDKLVNSKTKMVAVSYASNALGTINPIHKVIEKAHQVGAKVLIDGAQSSAHLQLDMQELDCDFYAFSGHKLYGPTGVGILYGKRELLEAMPPYQGGGEMIKEVSFGETSYADLPYKFEAGTPNIADVIALKAAVEFVNHLGKDAILKHEQELTAYATSKLEEIDGIRLIGTAKEKVSVVSFVFDDVHHQDLAIMLDQNGIAVRTGHHCAQPLMNRFDILGTTRASFAVYNTKEEIDFFVDTLKKVISILR